MISTTRSIRTIAKKDYKVYTTRMKNVTIYSTPTCVYCRMAKDYFKEQKIAFTEHNVLTDLARRKEMIEKSGQMGVPVIDIDGAVTIGFDKLKIAKQLGL